MNRGLLIVGALAAGLTLQACATTKPVAYGPVGPETPFGYKDRQNPDGGFTVSVIMPGHAAPPELRAFFERRAGELCPAGVERTNVFKMQRNEYMAAAPAVYGSAGISQRIAVGTELEGYVYCKSVAAAEAAPAAG